MDDAQVNPGHVLRVRRRSLCIGLDRHLGAHVDVETASLGEQHHRANRLRCVGASLVSLSANGAHPLAVGRVSFLASRVKVPA
jgi:hypothetical protein